VHIMHDSKVVHACMALFPACLPCLQGEMNGTSPQVTRARFGSWIVWTVIVSTRCGSVRVCLDQTCSDRCVAVKTCTQCDISITHQSNAATATCRYCSQTLTQMPCLLGLTRTPGLSNLPRSERSACWRSARLVAPHSSGHGSSEMQPPQGTEVAAGQSTTTVQCVRGAPLTTAEQPQPA